MLTSKLVNRLFSTPLVGTYLPPLPRKQMPDQDEALKRFKDPISLGDLNVDLD